MASGQVGAVVRQIERLFAAGSVTAMNEGQLLERFVTHRDEAAFAALVARYGPMVLGVCRQMLHDPNDVDDAFQATFLVLVKKAATLRNRDLLGNWLYGVAYKVAHRARTVKARRLAAEKPCVEELAMGPDQAGNPPQPWIHEEVQRLPEKYRTPVVLCYLQGLTHEQAAERLRWPLGTVKGRLARARDMLRSRLTRKGMAFSSGILFLELARDARATVPDSLFESTVRAATSAVSRPAAAGLISAQAAALSQGVLRTMLITQLKTMGVALLVAGVVTTGAGVLAYQDGDTLQKDPAQKSPPVTQVKQATPADKPAVAGETQKTKASAADKAATPDAEPKATSDLDAKARSLAGSVFDDLYKMYQGGEMNDLERLNVWSLRMFEATSQPEGARRAAAEEHLKRMQSLNATARKLSSVGRITRAEAAAAEYYVAEAQQLVAGGDSAKARQSSAAAPAPASAGGQPAGLGGLGGAVIPPGFGGGGLGGPNESSEQEMRIDIARMSSDLAANDPSPKSKAIWKKLEEPVSMSFSDDTPLEDVIKYIKSATQGPKDSGIPIYVDPIGLAEAKQKLTSPVRLDLEGVPLKTTLRLMLKQLRLAYCVKDGILMISSVKGISDELEEGQHEAAGQQ